MCLFPCVGVVDTQSNQLQLQNLPAVTGMTGGAGCLQLDSHVFAVSRVDGCGVAVAPQDDDGGQHVQRGVKLQKEDR